MFVTRSKLPDLGRNKILYEIVSGITSKCIPIRSKLNVMNGCLVELTNRNHRKEKIVLK